MTDDWWLMSDAWWLMTDDWWLMTDEWWLMTDDWWLMTDDWWLMTDYWLLITDYRFDMQYVLCAMCWLLCWFVEWRYCAMCYVLVALLICWLTVPYGSPTRSTPRRVGGYIYIYIYISIVYNELAMCLLWLSHDFHFVAIGISYMFICLLLDC